MAATPPGYRSDIRPGYPGDRLTTNLTPRKCLGFKTPFQALIAELGKEVRLGHAVLARQIRGLRPRLLLFQHPNDLLFREPRSLHLSVLFQGRTPNPRGGKSQWRSNVGYFIFRREIFDYINDGEELGHQPFDRLITTGKSMAYRYEGFWRAMDTLRDRQILEEMVERGDTPWRQRENRDRNLVP
jgi:hypothetical protein